MENEVPIVFEGRGRVFVAVVIEVDFVTEALI